MVEIYNICNKCVMDTSDSAITFDKKGICNHCNEYLERAKVSLKHHEKGQLELQNILTDAKKTGKGHQYDCIIGLSGGVDSSYVAYKIKKLGLRPLAVHFDSGWNSEQAVKNIENIVQKLGIDLYTHVCDWREMRDLQLSYFRAGVINADIPMDHAFMVVLHKIARKKNIKYFFSGHNFETEAILPRSWAYKATDVKNIKAIQKRFGSIKLKQFPLESIVKNLYTRFIFGFKKVDLLDFEQYDKATAMALIENELGWKYYGGKHYESIFTRFYQGYYLPKRFNVDKRRAHLSTLINSGQISREDAMSELNKPSYPDDKLLQQDMEFVPKKLGISLQQLRMIMEEPTHEHEEYDNDKSTRELIKKVGGLVLGKKIQL